MGECGDAGFDWLGSTRTWNIVLRPICWIVCVDGSLMREAWMDDESILQVMTEMRKAQV